MGTYFTGPLEVGTGIDNTGADTGYLVQSQTTTVTTATAGTATSATITLPANSQIVAYYVDGIVDAVVGGSGTATAVAVTVGTAAAGTQYMTSTDLIAGGRATTAITTAQAAAMDDIGSNTSVVITADPNGTILTTQGEYRLTVVYAQK